MTKGKLLRFLILCPRCPALAKKTGGTTFLEVLREARAEEPNHIACGGEIWVVYSEADALRTGEPLMWRPNGEAFAWKDIEPEPLVVHLPDGSVLRMRFPLTNEPIIEHGRQ